MSNQRSFAVKTTNLSTAPILLDDGVYAGVITNAAIEGKEGKQFINIVEETVWNKDKKGFVKTGDWVIEGNIFYGAALTSKKALSKLPQDEPKVFGGQIRLTYDKETFAAKDNHVLGATLEALDLHKIEFSEQVDWVYDENIDVPEELSSVPNIVHMLNGLAYTRAMFALVTQTMNGLPARIIVRKQARRNSPSQIDNVINCGDYASACGILRYVEGCENDLEG